MLALIYCFDGILYILHLGTPLGNFSPIHFHLWCIRCYLCEKMNPPVTKKPMGCRPPHFTHTFCLMAVVWYVCCIIWFMWTIVSSSYRWVSMVVADGLAPIWRQDICNHHDGIGWLACLKVSQTNGLHVCFNSTCLEFPRIICSLLGKFSSRFFFYPLPVFS